MPRKISDEEFNKLSPERQKRILAKRKYNESDKGKKVQQEYHINNREKIINRVKEWSENNKEQSKAYKKKYQIINKDKISERKKHML
jgi:hypothetical protein